MIAAITVHNILISGTCFHIAHMKYKIELNEKLLSDFLSYLQKGSVLCV